jgi:ATP sulfurylase
MIAPLGGQLRDRTLSGEEGLALARHAANLPSLALDPFQQSDFELLASGAYSPLEGFMLPDDYHGVLDHMHLDNGLPFPVPVTLAVSEAFSARLNTGDEIALTGTAGDLLGVMMVEAIYTRARSKEMNRLLGSEDQAHPGARLFRKSGDILIGGAIRAVPVPSRDPFRELRLTPRETRAMIQRRGWKSVVGVMPLNPLHRGDEYLLRLGLELTDGALVMPFLDQPTADAFSLSVRIRAMQTVTSAYFPQNRLGISGLPLRLRYYGTREAVFHALLARNYGCTHFIVSPSHPGLEQVAGPVEPHAVFDTFPEGSLGVQPLCLDLPVFNRVTGNVETWKTSPFDDDRCEPIQWSAIATMLENGGTPSPNHIRTEAAEILKADLQARPDYCI